jgi:hypothetical protein
MWQSEKRTRALSILACMVYAIALVFLPAWAFGEVTQNAIIATASPYSEESSTGAHCVASVDPAGGPRTIQTNLLPTDKTDIMVVAFENYFYRIERFQADNITKFDIAAPDTPIYQYSVLDSGDADSANPHGLIFLSAEKAYLLRYGKATAWIVNPSATTEAEFKIGELDLSAYADQDGLPEMDTGVIVDDILYITLQRMDRSDGWAPKNTSYVALFNTETDEEIDTGTQNPDDVKGIALPGPNTGAIQYLAGNDTIYIQAIGDYGSTYYNRDPAYTGGIITLNPTTYETALLVDDGDDSDHPYGNITGMAIVSAEKGYFVGYAGWGDNTLYEFSPTTGDVSGVVSAELSNINIAGMQAGAYADKNDRLWVCNQTDAEVVILDTEDNTIDEKLSTNLNPLMVVFTSEGERGSASGTDSSSGCFIDTILSGL